MLLRASSEEDGGVGAGVVRAGAVGAPRVAGGERVAGQAFGVDVRLARREHVVSPIRHR